MTMGCVVVRQGMQLAALAALAAVAVGCGQPVAAEAEIETSATSIASEDWLHVTWSGVPLWERENCWIGVYSPTDANVSAIDPLAYPATAPWTATATLKYQYCSVSPGFMEFGKGSYRFNLINMRDDVVFWLFYGGIHKPRAIAKSGAVSFTDTAVPKQMVSALTGDPTEMRVTWNSASPHGAKLRYGIDGDPKVYTLDADTTTYTASDLCGEPATTQGWRDPGYFHTAVIKGLEPGKSIVWYKCASNGTWSSAHTFLAAKSADAHADLHIVATADVGATEKDGCHYHWEEPDSNLTYQHMKEHTPADVALHIGDISYATGYAAKWDLFMTQASRLAATVPLMTALGNHEQDFPGKVWYNSTDSGGECGIPTITRFPMPTPGDEQKGWYSFDMGPVHFLIMDTELACGPGSEQYAFLEKDLASVNRSRTPWIVFGGHRAMYFVVKEGSFIDQHFQAFESLLMKYQVDLALWGHYHNAVRTCPVYNGTCHEPSKKGGYDAPVHVCIGNGGMNLTPIPPTRASWTEYQALEYGYSTINVNTTHLHMKLFADESDELHHEFVIERSFPRDTTIHGIPRSQQNN